MSLPHTRPLILCPLQFELKHLRAGLKDRFDFICIGPGEAGILRWAAQASGVRQPVILAGLAGALTNHHRAGAVAIIGEVIDAQSGLRWKPTIQLRGVSMTTSRDCVITSSPCLVVTRDDRQRIHASTGAHLVDFESVAFARAAAAARLQWAIVRGVSDDSESGALSTAADLVDQSGRTRPWAAFKAVARRPGQIPDFIRLARNSRQALTGVRILIGNSQF